jgi:hypothetical protein
MNRYMNRSNILTKAGIALMLATLLTTGAIWEVRRVRAGNPPEPDRLLFGMVGLTRGQTLRLNVVNLGDPPDPDRNGSRRVVLSFRNAQGQVITNSDGQPIRQTFELRAGESAFLDLNGDQFGSAVDTSGPARVQLRPFVRVLVNPPDPDRQAPPDPCRATMEVFDNATGRTSLFAPALGDPPEPDRHQ